jgi:hypothetical protein
LALRNLQQQANQKGTTITLSFERLNKLMQGKGMEQFSYDSFKAAYDNDSRIKTLVKNFDQKGVTLATDEESNLPQQDAKSDNTVSNMAKRATDLG